MALIKRKPMKSMDKMDSKESPKSLALALNMQAKMKPKASMPMDMEQDEDEMDAPSSMAEAIMRKRKAKMMAEGGMVEDDNEESGSTPYDDMNEEAAMKELYDDDVSAQPEDSNEHSDDIESDAYDMISEIRKKMRAKRGF